MKLQRKTIVTTLLGISVGLLALLVPGGPIENRDFSQFDPAILAAFNVFLTSLDLGTLVLMLFTIRGYEWALACAFYVGLAYFGVYAIDLAQIFPKSPTPMLPELAGIEVLGMSASIPLVIYSRYVVSREIVKPIHRLPNWLKTSVFTVVVVLGLAITWFATDSAIHSGTSF
ncbi:MAG: hypothetical protein AB8B48_21545 [Pseudomonadales bacterium]